MLNKHRADHGPTPSVLFCLCNQNPIDNVYGNYYSYPFIYKTVAMQKPMQNTVFDTLPLKLSPSEFLYQ
jgi:hypothetical protein